MYRVKLLFWRRPTVSLVRDILFSSASDSKGAHCCHTHVYPHRGLGPSDSHTTHVIMLVQSIRKTNISHRNFGVETAGMHGGSRCQLSGGKMPNSTAVALTTFHAAQLSAVSWSTDIHPATCPLLRHPRQNPYMYIYIYHAA